MSQWYLDIHFHLYLYLLESSINFTVQGGPLRNYSLVFYFNEKHCSGNGEATISMESLYCKPLWAPSEGQGPHLNKLIEWNWNYVSSTLLFLLVILWLLSCVCLGCEYLSLMCFDAPRADNKTELTCDCSDPLWKAPYLNIINYACKALRI